MYASIVEHKVEFITGILFSYNSVELWKHVIPYQFAQFLVTNITAINLYTVQYYFYKNV